MSVKWNLYAELGRDNEDLRQQLEVESTRRMLNRLAGIFLLVIYGSVMLATLFVEERTNTVTVVIGLFGLFFWAVLWQDWRTGTVLAVSAPLSRWSRWVKVAEAPLLLGALVWVVMRPAYLPKAQWLCAIAAVVLGYLAQVWAYDRFVRQQMTVEDYAQRLAASDGGRIVPLLTAVALLAAAVVLVCPETQLPGAKPLRMLEQTNTKVEAIRSAEALAEGYADKVQRIEHFRLGAEKLWVYYDVEGKELRGAYWEQADTGAQRYYDGTSWREGAAPDNWLTQLPQPLRAERKNLTHNEYVLDTMYLAAFKEDDLREQGLIGPTLKSYNEIAAYYIFRQNGTMTYYFEAYGQDSRGIPETLYHHLDIESTQPQEVAELLAQQKRDLFWPEEGDL